MDLDFDKELAVCEAATPGPWTAFPSDFCMVGGMGEKVCLLPSAISDRHTATAEFIANARQSLPEALRRLIRLREILQIGGNAGVIVSQEHWDEIRELVNIEKEA